MTRHSAAYEIRKWLAVMAESTAVDATVSTNQRRVRNKFEYFDKPIHVSQHNLRTIVVPHAIVHSRSPIILPAFV